MSKYFVTCARGVEEITEAELRAIGVELIERVHGGLFFEGDQDALYRAHLWLRTANRVLLVLRSFPVKTPDELYENLSKFKWETFLKPEYTFSVDCTISGRNSIQLNHSHYAKLKAKDAIVDRMRDKTGERPNVNVESPDIRVVLYIRDGVCTLNMDATGPSLHERGYRARDAAAPLKETLAAALLKLSGWKPGQVLVDPMCGSGTILAEAALMAANVAPGALRGDFAFMRWPDFHEPRWKALLEEADSKRVELPPKSFYGFDQDPMAVKQTRKAFQTLGLEEALVAEQRRFSDFHPPQVEHPGFILMNPPYGDRLGEVEELRPLYKLMGDTFKKKCAGWTAGVFTGSAELMKEIGLKTKRKIPLWNGPIECRLLTYELFQGARVEQIKAERERAAEAPRNLLSDLHTDVLEPAMRTTHSVNKLVNVCNEHWVSGDTDDTLEDFCAITLLGMIEAGLIHLYPDFSGKAPLSFSQAETALAEWTAEGFEGDLKLAILATEKGKRLFEERKAAERDAAR